jgi:hypothetical protein
MALQGQVTDNVRVLAATQGTTPTAAAPALPHRETRAKTCRLAYQTWSSTSRPVVVHGKGSRSRIVPLSAELAARSVGISAERLHAKLQGRVRLDVPEPVACADDFGLCA